MLRNFVISLSVGLCQAFPTYSKCSSLVRKFVIYGQKKFYNIDHLPVKLTANNKDTCLFITAVITSVLK
jgi:hypothetical protein